ncbi:hypothetical protein [Maritalea porphyrae]|uniref:hypothetical protein n=1 Tax=Maritalea porphyrae TaxID=880732 RepID=UPI0022AE7DFD|nr:hypothetical protein [Maritalea porphyrae]MCZ4273343.1 hypothetical protein [Maritalea porphyrae]
MRIGPVEVMRSPHAVPLLNSAIPSFLHYKLVSAPNYKLSHNRYANDQIAIPQIDLSQYRTSFCFDFIEFEIQPKQLGLKFSDIRRHLKNHLQESIWVEDQSKIAEKENRFTFRIQEFEPDHFLKLKQLFQSDLPLHADPKIVLLELSLDFRPKEISFEAFANMFAVLVRHFQPIDNEFTTSSDRMRMVSPSGLSTRETTTQHFMRTKGAICSSKVIDEPELEPTIGSTIYYGAQNTPYVSWRIMHKELDKQISHKGTRDHLPINKQRSRIEVTLGRHALEEVGLHSLRNLEGLNFRTTFSKFFNFVVPRLDSAPSESGNQLRRMIAAYLDKDRFYKQGAYRMKQRPLERAMRFEKQFKKSAPERHLGSKTVSYKELRAVIHSRLDLMTRRYTSNVLYK